MKTHVVWLFAASNLLAVVLTYGHAYHAPSMQLERSGNQIARIVGATFCAMAYPFYWSVHLMEPTNGLD